MTKNQKKTTIRAGSSLLLGIAVWLIEKYVAPPWWATLLMYAVPYAVIGYDVVIAACKNIGRGQLFDERFLMVIATVGAFGTGEYPEAVAVMLFYQIGELFQSIAVGKSRKSIRALMSIRPDTANVVRDGEEITVDPYEVVCGETVIVRPGEKIPLDGVVIAGASAVNTSALTGESVPQEKKEGDAVLSGCIAVNGMLTVRTTADFAQSTVSKILELVENASEKKAKTENFITRFAKYYTPAVVGAAVLLALLPPVVVGISGGGWNTWIEWLTRALTFLVVSCPCALVISVPLSFFGGIGGAAKKGILVKGSNHLEMLSKVKTVVFDKTGTLTEGVFRVTAVHSKECAESDLLDLAAVAESRSSHPIAESIVTAHGGHIDKSRIGAVSEYAGKGIVAEVDGKKVYVGNGLLMREAHADYHECEQCSGGTVVHLAYEGEYLGHITVSDIVKEDAKNAISELKRKGIEKTVMLTGDAEKTAKAVAKQLGIDEVHAQLLPQNKVEEVEKMLHPKRRLAFVGDGINDAPVLMRADIGVAMGGVGSDAAIEAADIVLMDDKPSKIPQAIGIARKTMRIAYTNIIFALGVKFIVLILAALGLASMWLAVFADIGVAFIAILNAMRALK